MFFVIIANDGIFWVPIWLGDNFPSFEYSGKIALITSLRKARRGRDVILVNAIQYPSTLKSDIYHSNKRVPPPFFHSNTNPVFVHVLIHYFDKIHVLFGTVELIWFLLWNILSFNFAPAPNQFLLGWQDSEEAM